MASKFPFHSTIGEVYNINNDVCRWPQLPWYGKMASKMLMLPPAEYGPYLSVLPKDIPLPATWDKEDIEQLQCDYIIEKVWFPRSLQGK